MSKSDQPSRPTRVKNFVKRYQVPLTAVTSAAITTAVIVSHRSEALADAVEFITEEGLLDKYSYDFVPSKYR